MTTSERPLSPYSYLSAFAPAQALNVIIETPQGHRNKFKYDEEHGLFQLDGILPAGAVFPYDFGFVPATRGGDGDPLDVLVLLDEPVFTGCLVPARLIGVITAEQEEEGKTTRNDRLIAVAVKSHQYKTIHELHELTPVLIDEIEHFFRSYNAIKGRRFTPLGRFGAKEAHQVVEEGMQAQQRREESST